MTKNKITIAIALFLVLTIVVTLVVLPVANAHDPVWNIQPYCYITASPDPVGVGQPVIVVFWLNYIPPTASGAAGDRWLFYLDITEPDETVQTVGPLTSDPVGGSYHSFTPSAVGEYTATVRFGPQVLTGSTGTGIPNVVDMFGTPNAFLNDTFLASSATTTFTVQEEQLPDAPSYPLPTEYWTRPIEGQNNEWYAITSNWLGPQQNSRFQPDGIAPNSPHIMWTKPLLDGGVVGGTNTGLDGMTFYDGTAYESKFTWPLIISGRLYYAVPKSASATGGGYLCVDLRTGEEIFWQNMTMPGLGQLYDYESMNQHGVIPNGYLWELPAGGFFGPPAPPNWHAYDSLTGNWLFTLTDVPSGITGMFGGLSASTVYGSRGEILSYRLNAAGNWLALWNNTAAHGLSGAFSPTDTTSSWYYQWRPIGKTVDASNAYSWNVTLSSLLPGPSPTIVQVIPDDLILGTSSSFAGISAWGTPDPWTMWAISLKPESLGRVLWTKNYPAPEGNGTLLQGPADPQNRVFTMWSRDGLTFSGYSLDDGKLLWTSEPEDAWGFYSTGWSVAYGNLYHCGYGAIYAYDLSDGSTIWNFSVPSGLATPYTYYPLSVDVVADGKVYTGTAEHSRNAPYWKDTKKYCLNATTGELIWELSGAGCSAAGGIGQVSLGYALADGFLTYLNLYDMQIYCIGKGPSAASVTASPKVSVHGSSVLVEGYVTDISAGTTQNEQKARFPAGVPAVSDESMSDWMEYIYMQKPMPTDVTGVEVVLETLDPNGNFYEIGRTTSDENGMYSHMFTPEVPGKYTIIASFKGSESYWGSRAETAIGVEEAPIATPTPTPPPPAMTDTYVIGFGTAALIAIIVIGVILILLRKR